MPSPELTPSILYPGLCYENPAAAIEWLCQAFGFHKRFAATNEVGGIIHAELTFDTAVIMLGPPQPEQGRISPKRLAGVSVVLSLRIDNPDAHFARARAAGAVVVRELQDEPYGSRGYMVRDPEGHLWYFGTYRPGSYWE
jgi:uncharacterized glyoxalase superfamily protein PhnB